MAVFGLIYEKIGQRHTFNMKKLTGFSLLAGINKGIGGGGFGPVVTLGERFSGVNPKSTVAITTVAEGVVSIVGVATFFGISAAGTSLDFHLLPSIFLGSYVGGILSPYLVRLLPSHILSYIIPVYAIALGIFLIVRTFWL
jgi:uncharacterized membrane protein YfcA